MHLLEKKFLKNKEETVVKVLIVKQSFSCLRKLPEDNRYLVLINFLEKCNSRRRKFNFFYRLIRLTKTLKDQENHKHSLT
jgi:hypothetical protein